MCLAHPKVSWIPRCVLIWKIWSIPKHQVMLKDRTREVLEIEHHPRPQSLSSCCSCFPLGHLGSKFCCEGGVIPQVMLTQKREQPICEVQSKHCLCLGFLSFTCVEYNDVDNESNSLERGKKKKKPKEVLRRNQRQSKYRGRNYVQ